MARAGVHVARGSVAAWHPGGSSSELGAACRHAERECARFRRERERGAQCSSSSALAIGASEHAVRRLRVARAHRVRIPVRSRASRATGSSPGPLRTRGIRPSASAAAAAAAAPSPQAFGALWSNPVFRAGFVAWIAAQALKVFTSYVKHRSWSWRPLFDSGGMPSSHSSLCMGVTTAVGLLHGVGSSLFPICLGFTSIVMYDASGVRQQAGKHAQVLNSLVEQSFDEDHPIRVQTGKLKEVLGHSKTQVFCGAVLGVLVGIALG